MSEKKIPRPEYPRPQMKRSDWINLNGEWDYSTDRGMSGGDCYYTMENITNWRRQVEDSCCLSCGITFTRE